MKIKIIPQLAITRRHPKGLNADTDGDYARFATRLCQQLRALPLEKLTNEEIEQVAISLTLYYEDVIAECGIFTAFTHKMQQIYGRKLPFYDIDETEYYDDEPNFYAVAFVVWNTLSVLRENIVVNPEGGYVMAMAECAYNYMYDEFENMPVNDKLKALFTNADFAADFYTMRPLLTWMVFDCYLTASPKTWASFEESAERITHKFASLIPLGQATYLVEAQMTYTWKCGPLALLATEWFAEILRCNGADAVAEAIAQQQSREYAPYRIMKRDKKGDVLLEAADGATLRVAIENIGLSAEEISTAKLLFAAFVQYKGEWHLNGIISTSKSEEGFDEEKKRKEKAADIGIPNYEKLMETYGGRKLFYFKNYDEMLTFEKEVMEIKNVETYRDNIPEEMKDATWTLFLPSADSGMDAYPDIADVICNEHNPLYNKDASPDEARNVAFNVSSDLARYLVEHHLLPDAGISSSKGVARGKQLLQDNFDFFIRSYKREMY